MFLLFPKSRVIGTPSLYNYVKIEIQASVLDFVQFLASNTRHKELVGTLSLDWLSGITVGRIDKMPQKSTLEYHPQTKSQQEWSSNLSITKYVTNECLEGGGVNRSPPPSTFNTIHLIDLKFGTYNKLHLYFQLSETTWCLISFHGNNSQKNDITGGCHLGFSNFHFSTSN